MYLEKSHLFTAKVLRDRPPPPPHHFLTDSLGTHVLIYLSLRNNRMLKKKTLIVLTNGTITEAVTVTNIR